MNDHHLYQRNSSPGFKTQLHFIVSTSKKKMMKLTEARALNLMLLLLLLTLHHVRFADSKTEEFHYEETCPEAEDMVREVVMDHFMANSTVPAALLRLFFHDCFVEGCDGSILLDASGDGDTVNIEKEGAPNKDSVRGFEVIDDAKAQLEDACPGVVSCADIVALAARDAIVLLGAPDFVMPTGRFDGRKSSKSEAERLLPAPSFNASQLIKNFGNQNLTVEDLVHLSGGHTIGQSQCRFFNDRLYNFSNTGRPDPSLNPAYLVVLQRACPKNDTSKLTNRVALDRGSEFVVDNNYYKNLRMRNGLLQSDSELVIDGKMRRIVRSLARNQARFQDRFRQSLIKMGNLRVKDQTTGEIRSNCRRVNPTRSNLLHANSPPAAAIAL